MARKVPAAPANDPDTARFAVRYDALGFDSEYYDDPVWRKCVELGIAPTFYSASSNQGLRLSPTNISGTSLPPGMRPPRRSDRALGTAQRQGIGTDASRQARPRQTAEPRRKIRL